jgi:hypothetical protein
MKPFGLFLMLEVGKRTVWSQIFMGKVLEIARAKAPGLKPLFAFGLRGPKAEAIGVARGKGEMQRQRRNATATANAGVLRFAQNDKQQQMQLRIQLQKHKQIPTG